MGLCFIGQGPTRVLGTAFQQLVAKYNYDLLSSYYELLTNVWV